MQQRWIWLFPITYLIHITEEYYGGEGFYRWISRLTGAHLTAHDFVVLNAIAWFVMVGAMGLVVAVPSCRFLLVAFGGVVLLNSLLHVSFSVVSRSYSPGAISGLLCWMPLGIYTLRRTWRELPHSAFGCGTIVSLCLHGLVSFSALYR
jgi:Protein of unknown function with HXXEE motif